MSKPEYDYIELGIVPDEETQPSNKKLIEKCCTVYRNQLIRLFGKEPSGCKLEVKKFTTKKDYYEVVCYYNSDDVLAVKWAYNLDEHSPTHWDEISKKQLNCK